MNALRPLELLTGVALLGVGGSMIARSLKNGDGASSSPRPRNGRAGVRYGHGSRIEKVFTIMRPAHELYDYWRDFGHLPSIMSHLERVEVIDDLRSRWSAKGPAGFSAGWEAEIIDDTPGRRIAWRSVGGSIPNAGSVNFRDAPGDRGTELRVEMEWAPPGGALGKSFAHLFGDDPGLIVETDLRRFKATMEAGYVALNGTDVIK
ncbi:MAG: SRPBCC family protein [Candidatus Eremiobacteraeota bacterium]|nr:SRPBCC family protein [Candidatus Eremiobacteraeota bacterium]